MPRLPRITGKELIAKNPSPIFRMSKEDVIKTLRETRERLWEEKVAHHR